MNYMTVKKRLLTEGLNFSLPLNYFDYADYLVHFELFYRNIHNLGISYNEDLDFVKTVRKKQPSLLIEAIILQHLSKEEFLALQSLRKNRNIVIQNSDKGNCVKWYI